MTDADFLWKAIIVATTIGNLVSIWAALRRKPPVVEEIYKDFATKEEVKDGDESAMAAMSECAKRSSSTLAARIAHSDSVHAELFGVLRGLKDGFSKDFQNLERGLGRIEGKMDAHLTSHHNTQE